GKCAVKWDELPQFAEGLIALLGSTSVPDVGFGVAPKQSFETSAIRSRFRASKKVRDREDALANTRDARAPRNPKHVAKFLISAFSRENVFIELHRHFVRGEERSNRELIDLAHTHHLPLVATNGVQYAKPYGREV